MASCVFNGDLSLSPAGTRPWSHAQTMSQLILSILLFVYEAKITKEGETATAVINDEEDRAWAITW